LHCTALHSAETVVFSDTDANNTFAWDGDASTYYDSSTTSTDSTGTSSSSTSSTVTSRAYTGAVFDRAFAPRRVEYRPMRGFAGAVVGGEFQGSNATDGPWVTLHNITTAPGNSARRGALLVSA
jgi:hypothetical protein